MSRATDNARRFLLTVVCGFVAPLSWSAVLQGPQTLDSAGRACGTGWQPILHVDADEAAPSLDAVVARIQEELHARVVRADVQDSGGRRVYVLRLLNDAGRVWTVRVDAATGAIE